MNNNKNQDIGPSSTAADYYLTRTIAPSNKPSFTHVSQYLQILCSRNGSLPKSVSPNHMKTSPIKAVIRLMLNTTRQYVIDITFVLTLTCFHSPWNHRFHNVQTWQPLKMERNIRTHSRVNYANTHENWTDSFYHSGNTGKSHNPYIDICFLLFLFLFVTFSLLVITEIIECVVNTCCCCFETQGTSACTSRSASCLINSVVKSSCPYLSGLCSSGISACFFLKSSNKINAFTRAISRKW